MALISTVHMNCSTISLTYPEQQSHPDKVKRISKKSLKRLKRSQTMFIDCEVAMQQQKRQRTYYDYSLNSTIARISEHPHTEGISPKDPDFKDWHQVVKDHAYRRMQIFYYQLLFYYQEKCRVIQGRTLSQHGWSSCSCCSAAHSAIVPNLIDEKGLMSQDLYLYHNMNSTIEMPDIVNNFDCVIEQHMRPIAIKIINLSSLNGIHPYEALQMFAEEFSNFFTLGKRETDYRMTLLDRIEHFEVKINELETQTPKDPITWVRKYAKAVYNLKESRKAFQESRNYTLPIRLDKYDEYRRELFYTIWSSCPREEKILDQITSQKQLTKYLLRKDGFPLPTCSKFSLNKKLVRNFIKSMHPVELWLNSEETARYLYSKISEKLPHIDPMDGAGIPAAREKLNASLFILELQEKGSICPPFKYLSGHMVKGKCTAYSVKQLLQQKKILHISKAEVDDCG